MLQAKVLNVIKWLCGRASRPFVLALYEANRETPEVLKILLSKPAAFKPFFSKLRTDWLFFKLTSARYEKYGGFKLNYIWDDLLGNLANGALDYLKKAQIISLSHPNKVEDVLSLGMRCTLELKIVEDWIYYHAEEIKAALVTIEFV